MYLMSNLNWGICNKFPNESFEVYIRLLGNKGNDFKVDLILHQNAYSPKKHCLAINGKQQNSTTK